ncbi:MAG: hypothetical protein ABSD30_10995, partial [Candidatus Binatus sp.]
MKQRGKLDRSDREHHGGGQHPCLATRQKRRPPYCCERPTKQTEQEQAAYNAGRANRHSIIRLMQPVLVNSANQPKVESDRGGRQRTRDRD